MPPAFRCLRCGQSALTAYTTLWRCDSCGSLYPCIQGVPKLYLEDAIGAHDRKLRDRFYGGLFGALYRHLMPFLTLPVRPFALSWPGWLVYLLLLAMLFSLAIYVGSTLLSGQSWTTVQIGALLLLGGAGGFLLRHSYMFYLFVLAVPVRIALSFTKFTASESFAALHDRLIDQFRGRATKPQLLDISTGNCGSLYRYWTPLDGEFTAVDLSERMLLRGLDFMTHQGVPVTFALADATNLPFQSDSFDVVLSYGAINGMSNPALALLEMARVAKRGGLIVFLDEQLYDGASAVERLYFRKVLSGHNTIHRCPTELIPETLSDIEVHQIYHFYYICIAWKR